MAEGLEPWPAHLRAAVTVNGVSVFKAEPPRRTYGTPRTRVGPKPGRAARRAHRKARTGEPFKAWLRRQA